MTDLRNRVEALSDSDLVEAGSQYLTARLAVQSDAALEEQLRAEAAVAGVDPERLLAFRDEMAADPDSYGPLMRLLLGAAAQGNEEERRALTEVLDGVGFKQMVPDPYLVAGLGLLVLMLSRKAKTTFDIEISPGVKKVKIGREVQPVSAGSALGKFFDFIKSLRGGA